MKFFVPLCALAAFAFVGCSKDVNRSDLYRPKKGDGYWTRSLKDGSYKDRKLVDAQLPGGNKPAPAEE